MTTDAHPDIEIYIKAAPTAAVVDWLDQQFAEVETVKQQGKVNHYRVSWQGESIPVLVVEKAGGIYTSVYFESPHTPWQQDIDCARQAYEYFAEHTDITGLEVRCVPGSWQEGDDPDAWLAINADGEQAIQWQSK